MCLQGASGILTRSLSFLPLPLSSPRCGQEHICTDANTSTLVSVMKVPALEIQGLQKGLVRVARAVPVEAKSPARLWGKGPLLLWRGRPRRSWEGDQGAGSVSKDRDLDADTRRCVPLHRGDGVHLLLPEDESTFASTGPAGPLRPRCRARPGEPAQGVAVGAGGPSFRCDAARTSGSGAQRWTCP